MAQTSYSATRAIALAGMLADLQPHNIITRANGEASAEVPFGVAVAIGASDAECELPAASNDKILGVAVHTHAIAPASGGVTGYAPNDAVGILRQGTIWVVPEDAVAEGGAVYVRHGGTGQKGAFLGADDTSNSSLLANALWRSTASGGEFALLELLGPVQAMS